MKRAIARALLVPFILSASALGASIEATGLLVDNKVNPIGVSATPRLSWSLASKSRAKRQLGCHILAASSAEKLSANEGDLCDLQKDPDANRHLRPWRGKPLSSGQEVHWKVRILDESKTWGEWSQAAKFTVGGSTIERTSSFESNVGQLNELYKESIAQLEERLKKYSSGDPKGLGTPAEVQRSAREFFYNFRSAGPLLQYLEALDDGRTKEGHYTSPPEGNAFNAIDSNAGIILPYALWWMAADETEARERWLIAERHLMARETFDPKFTGKEWGDRISAIDDTPPEYLNICLMGMATRIMRQLAIPAGEPLNVIRYKDYALRIKKSFQDKYIAENGTLKIKTQTAQLLALRCAVLEPEQQKKVIESLVASLKKDGIKVGPLGAEYLFPVLYLTGNYDLAFELVQKQMSGKTKDTFIGNGITDWMFTSLAGINGTLPGFQQVYLKPQIPSSDSIQWIKAHYDSSAGRIEVAWKKEDNGGLTFECTIPPGVYAQLALPATKEATITESGKSIKDTKDVELSGRTDTITSLVLQSGSYKFSVQN